ncbi:MAG: hypothetical protein WBO46_06485, partial [Caldilineaceae bacterium]
MKQTLRANLIGSRSRLIGLLLAALLLGTTGGLGATSLFAADPPTFTIAFSPSTIGPGSVATLTHTITTNANGGVRDLAFTNTLPGGVTIATPAIASTTCSKAILSAPDGGSTITFSGGSLPSGSSCTVTVNVTSSTAGTHTDLTGDLTSDAGNSGTATADLTVDANRLGFTKNFNPSIGFVNQVSTLTFAITNSAAVSVTTISFSDSLPAGMVIATPSNLFRTCPVGVGGFYPGSLTAASGGSTISYSSGTQTFFSPGSPYNTLNAELGPSSSCTISIDVITSNLGQYNNISGNINASSGSGGKASAKFIAQRLALSKTFTDDPVVPGGTANLEFTIINLDRAESLTNLTFTDDLDTVLSGLVATGLPQNNICGNGSTLSGTSILTLGGGNLGPEGSCTFNVTLQVPAGAIAGNYPNTTSALTGDRGGSGVVLNTASDTLAVIPAPLLTKEFIDNPVGAGGTVTLSFTITNTSPTSSATDITFTDEMPEVIQTASSVPGNGSVCGAGSNFSFTPFNAGTSTPATLSMTGGSLAAGASCTFSLVLDIPASASVGTYPNTTSAVTAVVDTVAYAGNPATDDLFVVAAPTLRKEFTDDPVEAGGTVTLQFTLSYPAEAPANATGITFTDDLATTLAGLTATGLPLTDLCGTGNGTLSGSAGDTLLTFGGATLAPGEKCTFNVTLNVPAGAAYGSIHTNTTSAVTATVSGVTAMGNPASDDLKIAGLFFTKEFIDDPAIAGDSVTLRFTISNTSSMDATGLSFTDSLAATLSGLASSSGTLTDPCGSGSSLSGTTSLTFTSGNLLAGTSCTFDVTVNVPAAATDGSYRNTTGSMSGSLGGSGVTVSPATDLLTVNSTLLHLEKSFVGDPVSPGDTVTLAFTLTNLSDIYAASAITFTDNISASLTGLAATGLPFTACGGTADGIPGPGTIYFSGGSLAASASCSFTVTLQVPSGTPTSSTVANTTSGITGTMNGLPVIGSAASDNLTIFVQSLRKSIAGPIFPGLGATLVFTVTNIDSVNSITPFQFSDALNNFVPGMVATSLPSTTQCGAGSSISGSSFLGFTNGELAPSASCAFSVTVGVPLTATAGVYTNTTSQISSSGIRIANPASASVTVGPSLCYATPNDGTTVYASQDSLAVQAAVESLGAGGGTVKVAGTCAGVQQRAGIEQTVYISTPVTLIGGFV